MKYIKHFEATENLRFYALTESQVAQAKSRYGVVNMTEEDLNTILERYTTIEWNEIKLIKGRVNFIELSRLHYVYFQIFKLQDDYYLIDIAGGYLCDEMQGLIQCLDHLSQDKYQLMFRIKSSTFRMKWVKKNESSSETKWRPITAAEWITYKEKYPPTILTIDELDGIEEFRKVKMLDSQSVTYWWLTPDNHWRVLDEPDEIKKGTFSIDIQISKDENFGFVKLADDWFIIYCQKYNERHFYIADEFEGLKNFLQTKYIDENEMD